MPSRSRVSPSAAAIEGGRVAIEGAGFPIDGRRCRRCAIGGAPRALVVRLVRRSSRASCRRASTAGRRAVRVDGAAGRDRVRRDRRAARDRPASGRQSGVRSRRQPLRHLQRHRAASRCRCRSSASRAERHARAVLVAASSTRRRWRSIREGRLYVSSRFEGTRLSRRRPTARPTPFAHRSRRRLRPGVRAPTARCLSAIARARSSASIASGRATTFASLPASVAAFHLAFGPDGALYVTGADAVVVRRALPHRAGRHGDDALRDGSAGRRGSRSIADGTLFVVEALAGASGLYRRAGVAATPELVLAGPGARRRRVRPARRPGRRVERDRLSLSTSGCTAARTHLAPERRAPGTIRAPCRNSFSASRSRRCVEDTHGEQSLKRVARRRRSDHAGDRRGDRRRHLRRDRHRGGRADRPERRGHPVRRRAGAGLLVPAARRRLRARRRSATRSWRR